MKTKPTPPEKSTPPPTAAATPKPPRPPRKNARRFDTDPSDTKGTVLSTRVSHDLKRRVLGAAKGFGCSNHSELICYALCRLFNQAPEIMEAYGKTGVLPMKLAAMKEFFALPAAPEEIEYARRWVPEKVERLNMKRLKIENTLNELLARLVEVERRLKIKQLEPEKKAEEPVRVEVDLV